MMGLYLFVTMIRPGKLRRGIAEGIVIGGGIVLPLAVLVPLLVWARHHSRSARSWRQLAHKG